MKRFLTKLRVLGIPLLAAGLPALLLAGIGLFATAEPAHAQVADIYVDADATGAGNGTRRWSDP